MAAAGPYGSAARAYLSAGWAPLPVPAGRKYPPPEGWTGHGAPLPGGADVESWCETDGAGNVAVRLPADVIGLDVDAYGGKRGAETLADLEHRLGSLPRTVVSSRRFLSGDWTSGIRLYRLPAGRTLAGQAGPGVDVIQHGHRYAVAAPSLVDGAIYATLDERSGELCDTWPPPAELPELPGAWLHHLEAGAARAERDEHADAYLTNGRPCRAVLRVLGEALGDLDAGAGRHDRATAAVLTLVRLGEQGHYGARRAVDELRAVFVERVTADASRRTSEALAEYGRMVDGAAAKVAETPTPEHERRCCPPLGADPLADLVAPSETPGAGVADATPAPVTGQSPDEPERMDADEVAGVLAAYPRLDLAALLAAETTEREWLVADLLPARAAVSLVAGAGVGKSLLALALALAVARGAPFAGLAVPHARRVLYIDCENSRDDLRERLAALGETPATAAELERLTLLHLPDLPPLDTASGGAVLQAVATAYGLGDADLVVLDSQQRVTQGPENDSDTQRAYYRHTGAPLKRLGLTVLRTDNTGKDAERGARGSSGKRDDVDLEWLLQRAADDGSRLALRVGKNRLPDVADLLLSRDVDDAGRLVYSAAGDPFRLLVAQCAARLDELRVPVEAGERVALRALSEAPAAGRVRYSRTVVRAAVKARKTAPDTNGAPPGAPGSSDRAAHERRTPAHLPSEHESSLLSGYADRAHSAPRTPRAPHAAAPADTAPPLSLYRERRGGAPSSGAEPELAHLSEGGAA